LFDWWNRLLMLCFIFRQIDLQLESGEYFLKPSQKQEKEDERRQAKVRLSYFQSSLTISTDPFSFISKRPSRVRDRTSERRRSLRPKSRQLERR
jgi:hypothetical protein